MTASSWIAVAAIAIALLTFVATQIAARRAGIESASDRRIRNLEGELVRCEQDRDRLERSLIDKADENLRLLQRIVGERRSGESERRGDDGRRGGDDDQ